MAQMIPAVELWLRVQCKLPRVEPIDTKPIYNYRRFQVVHSLDVWKKLVNEKYDWNLSNSENE